MSALLERGGAPSSSDEIEISLDAIAGYARLLRVVGPRLVTHATTDGGLICEYRPSRARPIMWRVRPDGEIVSDTPYSYALAKFVTADLPPHVAADLPARVRST